MKRNNNFNAFEVNGRHLQIPNAEQAKVFDGIVAINETGRFLWDLLQAEQTVSTMAQALADQYEVSASEVTADVQAFVEVLTEAGAVEGSL